MESGIKSSEFKLTAIIMFVGIALDVTGILLETMKGAGASFGWLPTVLAIVGSLMVLAKGLGYTRSRTMLKLADLQGPIASEVKDMLPLVKELALVVKDLKKSGLTAPSP